ncbi:sodium/hydrogen exchanger-like domain-containing protein 1, partial [Cricetulus griseus]
SEAPEGRLSEAVIRSVHHRGLFGCLFLPLPHEVSLAVGVPIRHMHVTRLPIRPSVLKITAITSSALMLFPILCAAPSGDCAVSPAVVVPSMLLLQENGYGIEKGIPTLLVAASSMDDVVAITGFNTFLSIVFSSGSVISNILSSLRNVFIGVLVGITLGFFIQYFPSGDQEKPSQKRAFLVLSMCISAVLSCQYFGLHGSGGLVTLVLSFMAAKKWAKEKVGVQKIVANTWNVFQPLLFGLVGTEVSVEALESKTIGMCIATLGLALCVRVLATFTLMSFADFRFKEKVFIALAWIPKATVQAVLGPLALETARKVMAPQLESYSKDVMTVAFLAILITAPNGALLIGILGPKILERGDLTTPLELELSQFEQH